MPEERTRAARLLAERALLWIMHRLSGQDMFMVVLGGLVPDVLTEGQDTPAPRHIGTTDVDVHINFHPGMRAD